MSFNDNVTLDTSQVRSGGGGGGPGGMVVGGGIGGIIMLILALIFGINPGRRHRTAARRTEQGQVQAGGEQSDEAFAKCKTGADANTNTECRVIGTVNSVQAFWARELPRYGKEWQDDQDGALQRGDAVGVRHREQPGRPVLLPARQVGLHRRRASSRSSSSSSAPAAGPLAQEYVVAHEYGHALQDQLGLLGPRAAGPAGPRVRRGAHRADGRLPRRRVGQARDDREGRGHRARRSSSRSPTRTSRTPCPRRPPSATTASRRRPRAGSTPRTGRTARPRRVSGGSSRATRPATSTSATPSPSSPSTDVRHVHAAQPGSMVS